MLLYKGSSKSKGAIVEIVDLRVESMYSPSDRHGRLASRSREDALAELRTAIPAPLLDRYNELTSDATNFPCHEEAVELGEIEGCRLGLTHIGGIGYLLQIIPVEDGAWRTLQDVIDAEQRIGMSSVSPSDMFRIHCLVAGRLYESAWDIQRENWRRGAHWSEHLDALGS